MIVVDASVAAKWIFLEAYSFEARMLLRAVADAGETIAAPPLLPIEVTNTIRQRMRRDDLSLQDAQAERATFFDIAVKLQAPPNLYSRALQIAEEHNLPSAYDAHYVALADLLGCPLWTHDQRLLRALGGKLPFVRSIEDYVPPNDSDE